MTMSAVAISSGNRSCQKLPSLDVEVVREICTRGLSAVRPLIPELARQADTEHWNYGDVSLPSYKGYGRMRAALALEIAHGLQPRRVLEVAAGDAALCASLQEKLGCEVFANDLRTENLQRSLRKFANARKITVLSGNLFELDPAAVGSFDLVVACEVIEHVAHTPDFLNQLRRFLTPGGKLLITTPNGDYFHNHLPTYSQVEDFSALESKQFKPDADGHLFLLTAAELTSLAKDCGMRVDWSYCWATPAVTGHCGFRFAAALRMVRPWYWLERAALQLPDVMRRRLTFSLYALLSRCEVPGESA
jgi:2-polyprenyl-3-methyl-5-hydroxy-6-metoxy-1,4-benzoquinol methylase